MKKIIPFLLAIALLIPAGCTPTPPEPEGLNIVATTYPVYMLTRELVKDTPHTVSLLVQDSVSCLHDYTLTTTDMKTLEAADVVVMNGAGLESFMHDMLDDGTFSVINASAKGFELLEWDGHAHTHDGESIDILAEDDHHDHDEELDPHVWMSLHNYAWMLGNIREELITLDPEHEEIYKTNNDEAWQIIMNAEWDMQTKRSEETFQRSIITFHDGFAYFAQNYDLHILRSIEEEAGSEASAKDMEDLIWVIRDYRLNTIYVETLGSTATADALARETGVEVKTLDMCMSGDVDAPFEDYIARFEQNLQTLLEDKG